MSLDDIIRDNTIQKGSDQQPSFTVKIDDIIKQIHITKKKTASFWNAVIESLKNDEKYTILESLKSKLPIMSKIVLKYENNNELSRRYSEAFRNELVYIHQYAIKYTYDVEEDQLACCVLEGEVYTLEEIDDDKNVTSYIVETINLHFPFCVATRNSQLDIFRKSLIHLFEEMKFFDKVEPKPINSLEEILDISLLENDIPIYGSIEELGAYPNMLTVIYPYITNEMINSDVEIEKLDINDIFDVSELSFVKNRSLRADFFVDSLDNYLPILLSIDAFSDRVIEINRENIEETTEEFEQKKKLTRRQKAIKIFEERIKERSREELKDEISTLKELIPIISKKRLKTYNSWLEVGQCIYNITNGDDEGYNLWYEWTAGEGDFSGTLSDPKKAKECDDEWSQFEKTGITIGTIKYWARIDNAASYIKWRDSNLTNMIKRAIGPLGSPHEVAKIVHRLFNNEFICVGIKTNLWYQFKNHRWHRLDDAIALRQQLTLTVAKLFETQLNIISEEEEDEDKKEILLAAYAKMVKDLGTPSYKNNVIRECAELFYDAEFIDKSDENPALICFTNGVFDLDTMTFRDGRPEDCITLCTMIAYKEYDDNDEKVKNVERYLKQVFTEEPLRRFFRRYLSSCLKGGNIDKKLPIWIGEGDNSKSIVESLVEKSFGKYCIKFPTSILTGKRGQSSGVSPELVRTKGVRMAFVQEPSENDKIDDGKAKEMVSTDTFYARDLFQSGKDIKEITPQYKVNMVCNKAPRAPASAKALWNRICLLEFSSTFSDDAPETEEEQFQQKIFPKDPRFHLKIKDMVQPFMWLLIQEYKNYDKYGLEEPIEVKEATKNLKEHNDIYAQYIDECIENVYDDGIIDVNADLNIADIFDSFKTWFKESYPGWKCPSKIDLRDDLRKRLGEYEKGYTWHGIQIIPRVATVKKILE